MDFIQHHTFMLWVYFVIWSLTFSNHVNILRCSLQNIHTVHSVYWMLCMNRKILNFVMRHHLLVYLKEILLNWEVSFSYISYLFNTKIYHFLYWLISHEIVCMFEREREKGLEGSYIYSWSGVVCHPKHKLTEHAILIFNNTWNIKYL